jgi:DNA-directed RNA polymerase subunit RPC12/RpoP
VLALEVIEHLPFEVYEKTLNELQRLSAKHIIITVPHQEKDRLIRCKYCGGSYSPYFHLREFDRKKMENLFEGFSLIKSSLINKYRSYFIWDFLRKTWYIKIKKADPDPPVHSACPHCGFHLKRKIDEDFQIPSKINKIKTSMRSFTPFRYSYSWIACLYQKK